MLGNNLDLISHQLALRPPLYHVEHIPTTPLLYKLFLLSKYGACLRPEFQPVFLSLSALRLLESL